MTCDQAKNKANKKSDMLPADSLVMEILLEDEPEGVDVEMLLEVANGSTKKEATKIVALRRERLKRVLGSGAAAPKDS